ncbi:MAG TPA: undecaprenyl-diphosphate phosphatase [Acidimicrobiia bacterium]
MLRRPLAIVAACVGVIAFALMLAAPAASASTVHLTPAQTRAARHELTATKATVLGIVEGVTEFLPISSTGHLLYAERLMHVGDKPTTKDAADTYTIVIQLGAILAVIVVFWGRIVEIFQGLLGRSAEGRRLLMVLLIAFLPAAIIGFAFEDKIKDHLLDPGPVAAAWLVGGLAIFAIGTRLHRRGATSGKPLEAITNRDALIIGFAQALALWPGTSRSLVTILAALLLDMSLVAAVEFSFILGLLTLGAATLKDLATNGKQLTDVYGTLNPTIGFVVAFVFALIAIKWMITYLQRHGLEVFGWYRIIVAAAGIGLIVAGTV